MIERNYFIEGLFVLLGLALIITIVKYPKDTLITLPLGIVKILFRRIWEGIVLVIALILMPLIYLGERYQWKFTSSLSKFLEEMDGEKDDKPYSSKENQPVDFIQGDKFIFVASSDQDVKLLIESVLDTMITKYKIDDFKIVGEGLQKLVECPEAISFYDFHVLIQGVHNELGDKKSYGVFKSEKLQYFVFQDNKTLNNLVGFTTDKKYFSINMYDDLETKQYLKLNPHLKLETGWVERLNGDAMRK